ncbi:MAG: hypothetical protein KF823_01330 [Xanthomonadales bacterium]|nr:hypothetical protein [Xanthomonadales bacterium]
MKTLACITLAMAATALGSAPAALAVEEDPQVIAGTPDLGFYRQDFRSQVGMGARRAAPSARYRSSDGTSSYNCNNNAAGGERTIRYPFTVPDSRVLEWVRVWGVKGASTSDLTLNVHRSCMAQSQVTPTTDLIVGTTLTSTSGQFSTTLFAGNNVPNNLDCKYWLEVVFGSNATACAANHVNLRIYKMRIQTLMPDRLFRHGFRIHVPG